MAYPEHVAHIIEKIKCAVNIPVTVKHRLGIDHADDSALLYRFGRTLIEAGCDRLIIHARIARLRGASPKENRSVPPLQYDRVYRLKEDFPDQLVDINGGIHNFDQVVQHLEHVDGVMLGRAAYQNPYMLAQADRIVYSNYAIPTREQIVEKMINYLERCERQNIRTGAIVRHLFGLYRNQPGARAWRRFLTQRKEKPALALAQSLKIVANQSIESASIGR